MTRLGRVLQSDVYATREVWRALQASNCKKNAEPAKPSTCWVSFATDGFNSPKIKNKIKQLFFCKNDPHCKKTKLQKTKKKGKKEKEPL